jgi:hypothetical protein
MESFLWWKWLSDKMKRIKYIEVYVDWRNSTIKGEKSDEAVNYFAKALQDEAKKKDEENEVEVEVEDEEVDDFEGLE